MRERVWGFIFNNTNNNEKKNEHTNDTIESIFVERNETAHAYRERRSRGRNHRVAITKYIAGINFKLLKKERNVQTSARFLRTSNYAVRTQQCNASPLRIVMNSVSCVSNRSNYSRKKNVQQNPRVELSSSSHFHRARQRKSQSSRHSCARFCWEVNLFGSLIWHLWNEMKEGKVPQDYRWVVDKWTHTTGETFVFVSSSFFFLHFFPNRQTINRTWKNLWSKAKKKDGHYARLNGIRLESP